MSGKARPIGHAGDVVRSNIRRIRNALGISQERLSELLSEVQNPIATVGVWRLENGARQVTIDDLFAIAKVLGLTSSRPFRAGRTSNSTLPSPIHHHQQHLPCLL